MPPRPPTPPPPGMPPPALELWRRILGHRTLQMQTLSPANFRLFGDVLALDLKISRRQRIDEGSVDLLAGYSPPDFGKAGDVACHLLALFYRSVDGRLSEDERKYGLRALKSAFLSLDNALQNQAIQLEATATDNRDNSRTEILAPSCLDSTQKNVVQSRHDDPLALVVNNGKEGEPKAKGVGGKDTCAPTLADDAPSDMSQQLKNAKRKRKVGEKNNHNEGGGRDSIGKRQRTEAAVSATTNTDATQGEPTRPSCTDGDVSSTAKSQTRIDAGSSLKSSSSSTDTARSGPLPLPLPFFLQRSVTFLADDRNPPASGSLAPRGSCTVHYDTGFNADGSGSCLDAAAYASVRERLATWDPYWNVVEDLGMREASAANGTVTYVGTRTTACAPFRARHDGAQHLPASCAVVTADLSQAKEHWGVRWGEAKAAYQTGDRRLLLRMLPLKRSEKESKRQDTHRWPIGTFLQLSRGARQEVQHLTQRRQQSHDLTLWKGLCDHLDMTSIIPDARLPFSVKICAREVIDMAPYVGTKVSKLFEVDGKRRPFAGRVTAYDSTYRLYQVVYEDGDAEELTQREVESILIGRDSRQEEGTLLHGSYGIQLAICQYTEPDDLYNQLVDKIPTLSLESSRIMARKYLERQTVSLDSDEEGDKEAEEADNEGGSTSGSNSLTFSLLCPLSRMAIGTPVRGQRCRHMQCFDLRNWLQSNKHVSGGRWRCGCCEDFVAARDLVRCGLFDAMLREYGRKVSGVRDKISYRPDGSWFLKGENKLRYSGTKSNGAADEENVCKSKDSHTQKETKEGSPEVIDLL